MVKAKRQRNQKVLEESGLLSAVHDAKEAVSKNKKPNPPRGLQKRKTAKNAETPNNTKRRQSNRLQGIHSDGLYVDEERAGRFIVVGGTGDGNMNVSEAAAAAADRRSAEPEFYRGRANDGAPMSVKEAVEGTGPKWVKEDSVDQMLALVRDTLKPLSSSNSINNATKNDETIAKGGADVALSQTMNCSPTSVHAKLGGSPVKPALCNEALSSAIDALKVDDDACVAKVCPERIYSVAVHPSHSQLIVCAGDKAGHVGIWNVDNNSSAVVPNDGVHLFRPHRGAVSCLQWTGSGCLFSASYDGTVRWFDAASERFEEIFATYDDGATYNTKLGFALDTGSRFWTQYGCLDPRFANEKCMFLSTSVGTAMHVDLRAKQSITFHEEFSEKKINTLRYVNGFMK